MPPTTQSPVERVDPGGAASSAARFVGTAMLVQQRKSSGMSS